MKLFNIKHAILSLFRNDLINSLDYQRTTKLESKPKFEENIGERTKLRYNKLQ